MLALLRSSLFRYYRRNAVCGSRSDSGLDHSQAEANGRRQDALNGFNGRVLRGCGVNVSSKLGLHSIRTVLVLDIREADATPLGLADGMADR
jgi:hypothetical protein